MSSRVYSSLHLACQYGDEASVEKLLDAGHDPSLVNANGETGLHGLSRAICGAGEMAELLCRDGTLPIDARNNQGRTALHLALANNKTRLGDFLLRRGADPNALDHEGRTPLHAMFEKFNRVEIMRMFFKVNDEMQREVLIDVQDIKGVTPLQVALTKNFQAAVKLLLKRGADPNVANEKGLTPLHIICQGKPITYEGSTDVEPYKGDKFFRLIYGSRHHIVRTVDAQDESGNTPLHYAVKISGDRVLIRLLLKSGGANLNATNAEGLTPVETIYGNHSQDGLVDMLYKMSCEFKQPLRMRLDAPYDRTRSLLQWAVASLRPKLVDVYLRSTSDPASFKFPSVQDFDELYVNTHVLQERMTREQERSPRLRKEFEHQKNAHRLAVILDATSIVRRLQHKGYELKRSDALTLMKVFHKLGFAFGDPVESFNQDKFTDSSKRIMIGKSVSLHDFMHLPLERTFKLVTFGQLAIAQKRVLKALADDDARDAVRRKMTSTLLRQFTRAWAWYSFPQPLPDLCLNTVFEHLSSKDFWSMTAAAELREAAARDDARNRKRKRS